MEQSMQRRGVCIERLERGERGKGGEGGVRGAG
jgi:hypothetical protein